jgi:hypothetical protein
VTALGGANAAGQGAVGRRAPRLLPAHGNRHAAIEKRSSSKKQVVQPIEHPRATRNLAEPLGFRSRTSI